MFDLLQQIRDALKDVPNINTVKIGVEKSLNAKDYPFIRVVAQPSKPNPENFRNEISTIEIVYGEMVNVKQNLEAIYQKVYETEKKIREIMSNLGAKWVETIPDGDRLQNMKVSSIYFEIETECE